MVSESLNEFLNPLKTKNPNPQINKIFRMLVVKTIESRSVFASAKRDSSDNKGIIAKEICEATKG